MPKFDEVLKEERQSLWPGQSEAVEPEAVGLAFSGGGIRSATFNLGVLQGLAQAKLLKKINYLSTVSGGGYIGGWLISWIKRAKIETVQNKLGDYQNHRDKDGPIAEPQEVNFLRDYSNYMTPRLGIFGADTWAAIATYLRNVFLNQLILISLAGAFVLSPWILGSLAHEFLRTQFARHCGVIGALSIAGVLLLVAVGWASGQVERCSLTKTDNSAGQAGVIGLVGAPLFLSATFASIGIWLWNDAKPHPVYWALASGIAYGLSHVIGVIVRLSVIRASSSTPPADSTGRGLTLAQEIGIPVAAFLAGTVAGLLLWLCDKALSYWKAWGFAGGGGWHAVAWGPPIFVVAFLLTGTLHIGLLRLLIRNEEQEWWGRIAGLLLLGIIGWAGLFTLSIFSPWLLAVWGSWVKTKFALLGGWAVTAIFGLISGKSDKTSGKGGGNPVLEFIAVVSPYVFIVGLLILLSLGDYRLVVGPLGDAKAAASSQVDQARMAGPSVTIEFDGPEKPGCLESDKSEGPRHATIKVMPGCGQEMKPEGASGRPSSAALKQADDDKYKNEQKAIRKGNSKAFWQEATGVNYRQALVCFLSLFVFAAVLSSRVDINVFSMNLLYRNRLVRCYLGASRLEGARHPNRFTGFDPADDVFLMEFADRSHYDGPYPIVCTALNVTHGERLAWQERKAESFVFAPKYCGYEFPEMLAAEKGEAPLEGFQDTQQYAYPVSKTNPTHADKGGVQLGTAISISGAAASPNMGYHTSPPLAFLMTLFDVRLGWWLPNSRYKNEDLPEKTPQGGPRFSLVYLLLELFASTTDKSKYVYLSDGGHFENLAVYELVRRRCKYIIACDADADEGTTFGDLGNTIRKCRSDFGVEITLDDAALLQPNRRTKFAERHGIVGTIHYPPGPNGKECWGHILYIKPTITKGVPRDVLAYRDSHPAFPDQTTADQWFDESQFESYRELGLYSFQSLNPSGKTNGPLDLKTFFDHLAGQAS